MTKDLKDSEVGINKRKIVRVKQQENKKIFNEDYVDVRQMDWKKFILNLTYFVSKYNYRCTLILEE